LVLIAWQQPVRRRTRRVVALCLAALTAGACAASVVALTIAARAPARPDAAQIITAREMIAKATPAIADDPDLADDEATAGAMWAKANHPKSAARCPTYSAAFHRGCADTLAAARD
jgi:hypothetical protein